jgi:tight adherence protein B
MPANLLPFLTFGAVAMAVAGIYSILSDLYFRDRTRLSDRVDEAFRKRQRERARRSLLSKDLAKLAAEVNAEEADHRTIFQRIEAMTEQSGLDLTARQLQTYSIAAALISAVLLFVVRGSVLLSLLGAGVGGVGPILSVHLKRNARLDKLRSQLPDAFDLMSRVLRAGQTMSQALLAVADEFPQPISGEFAYCYEQQNLGLSPENAFRDLGRRTGLLEIRIFVVAILVQQQTGGNLAELLDKLSSVIRDRFRINGQIKSLTAEGRMQGAVLLGLPVGMFVIMYAMNPDYARVLLQHPSLIVATLVSEAFGALWIRSIVNFDF